MTKTFCFISVLFLCCTDLELDCLLDWMSSDGLQYRFCLVERSRSNRSINSMRSIGCGNNNITFISLAISGCSISLISEVLRWCFVIYCVFWSAAASPHFHGNSHPNTFSLLTSALECELLMSSLLTPAGIYPSQNLYKQQISFLGVCGEVNLWPAFPRAPSLEKIQREVWELFGQCKWLKS